MSRLWKKASELTITKLLNIGRNASLRFANPNGSTFGYSPTVETLAAARTLTADDLGKTFFLGLAGGFSVVLPAPVAGGRLKFVVSVSPTTAYVLTTGGSANIIAGGINELEVDTASDGPYDTNADTLTFVANIAVIGDYVNFISDGTTWFIDGQTNADGGIALATAS